MTDVSDWTADLWLRRAARTIETAELCLPQDPGSACNRAYYAMFYAARAGLIAVGEMERARGKTHAGTRAAFSEFLVKPGHLDVRHSRAFAQVEHHRLLSDYLGEDLEQADGLQAITQAAAFVDAVRDWIDARADSARSPSRE